MPHCHPIYCIYLKCRQCDNSLFDTFDNKNDQEKDSSSSASKEHKSAQNNTAHGTKKLTGSELVRKFVTFHFFFPVGQHHPGAGTPLLTRENGLLNYQANCDKVNSIDNFLLLLDFQYLST